ncbi:alginate lyase [Rahnella sp. AA]|uniref:alginate lyase family protein n=1 Tax=Rahnella sp. AA TaxID=2057180 RepID=UPI000C31DD91|nr:alginate lyase family protein [Rahnella sp. AA]PKE27866.1 alginate lyase [Rahnella sp. AA]
MNKLNVVLRTLPALLFICSGLTSAAPSRYFTYDAATLAQTRSRVAEKNSPLLPAYQALLTAADKALQEPVLSVAQKTLLPASGDKHDYYSFGPYWWPNPDTASHLPYIRKDGKTNPDSKTDATDSTRLVRFGDDMRVLGLAYYFSGNRAYAVKTAEMARAWFINRQTLMNPNMAYAQAIPGIVEGRGIGIIDSRVLIDVMDSIELIRPADTLSEADYQAIKRWYGTFSQWLLTSDNGFEESNWHNNHGAFYDAQVVAFSLFSDHPDVAKQQMRVAMLRHLTAQIDRQGYLTAETERTRSWHYTQFALSAFQRLARYGELTGVDLWNSAIDDHKLEQALTIPARFIDKQAEWPFPELKFEPQEALGNLLAATRAYPKNALFREKAQQMSVAYPDNINLLTTTAPLVR